MTWSVIWYWYKGWYTPGTGARESTHLVHVGGTRKGVPNPSPVADDLVRDLDNAAQDGMLVHVIQVFVKRIHRLQKIKKIYLFYIAT